MKALVTGATGFIGSHLVEALFKKSYNVTCLVRPTSDLKWIESLLIPQNTCSSFGLPSVEAVYGDCLDKESLRNAVKDYDFIFHLAGITKACRDNDFYCSNVGGTENLTQAILNSSNKIKRLVFLSSLSAVGPSENGVPVNEKTEPNPVSIFGKSKLEAEQIVLDLSDRIPVTIIRPSVVYGPRDKNFYAVFKLIKRGIFPYWGESQYSLVYVDDLIQGMILAAEKSSISKKVFFISDNLIHTNEEIAYEIAKNFNKQLTRIKIPKALLPFFASISEKLRREGIINRDKMRELYHPYWLCDSTLAYQELSYKPKATLKEGLKWTVDWYRINRWL